MATVVQVAVAASNPTAATLTATFGANTTVGNTLVAMFATGYAGASALTADAADTWTALEGGMIVVDSNGTSTKAEAWYVLSCVGGKTGYGFSRPTTGNCSLLIAEISGLTSFDVSTHSVAATTSAASTGSATTTNASDLLVALFVLQQAYPPAVAGYDTTTLTAGWTWQAASGGSTGTGAGNHNSNIGLATQAVSSTGSYSASVGSSGGASETATLGMIVAFAAAGGAADPYPAEFPRLALNPNAWVGIRM